MRLLVVSDGRRGIENQALGLAEAIARQAESPCTIQATTLNPRASFAALPPSIQGLAKRDFGLPPADITIGCGRQAIAPLLSLRRMGRPDFTVYVQNPRMDPSRFDLVVAPEHDGLSGPFVENMIGSPNRVTKDKIIGDTLVHSARLATFSRPRAMIAIGGPSGTHAMDKPSIEAHLDAAQTLLKDGYSLLVTTSRRTSDTALGLWGGLAATNEQVWLHGPDSGGPNPYFAFLGGADVILVTEDSTNMLTESCATGKPVYRLAMSGGTGKFQTLYDQLAQRCGVHRWNGTIDTAAYPPLAETERVAARILQRIAKT